MVLSSKLPEMDRGLQWPALCEKIERLQPIRIQKQVIWEFPPIFIVKVNTDGIYIKESDRAGIGGIVRDNRGDLIMAFSVPVTSTSNNMIEELAIEFRVKWCSQRGYTNFILELDSLIIANMLIKKLLTT